MPRGGARPNSGGRRAGAGRPRKNLSIDDLTARRLHTLTQLRRLVAPQTTEEAIIAELVAIEADGMAREVEHHASQQ